MNAAYPYISYIIYSIGIVLLFGAAIGLRSLLIERSMLRELAYRDTVTGLFNRNGMDYFWSHFKGKENIAVLCLDLDHFKEINDTYGHGAGDLLLQEVSLNLRQITNKNQLAYRIGGDEFLFILKNCDMNKVEILAGLLLDKISRPSYIQGRDIAVTGSIGISISPGHTADRARMLKEADIAMYQAKRLGKNRYCVYRGKTDS
ncbi:diguanylate cyclase (GGDEF)-like protein [Paenibacillus castaneae]|uniref:GGDEF domain-containing protein n=1 Tax=Paenibacillus castaneae TaxID=474957 RepID=UPI000C9BC3B0|nr:GGDEF domain-containing protein [Paenibacillus castaneae]NIK79166.1 diguanylate cyclase (GGDEF)-like protein [Paenibacillus castaneae]